METPRDRYVVSKRSTGLGDCLISLIPAWRFAKCTNRVLAVDWRFSRYAVRAHRNVFGFFFETPEAIAGVPVICDDRINRLSFPGPCFPSPWTARLIHMRLRRPDADILLSRDEAVTLINRGTDLPAPTVVFSGCINDALPGPEQCRAFLQCLRPRQRHQKAIDRFHERYFAGKRVVGLHIRHGNGGNIMGHSKYWTNQATALHRCIRVVQQVVQAIGGDAAVFLCTDSKVVQDFLASVFPNLITRPKTFKFAGTGELHSPPFSYITGRDALIEMFLLAQCQVLVRFPPGSFFSFYASHCKRPCPRSAGVDAASAALAAEQARNELAPTVIW